MEAHFDQASDQELLSLWQQAPGTPGARPAAAELLGRYRQRIYRWCRRYVREPDEALDLAQDVLLTAFEQLETLPAGIRFGAWMYTVTRNRCLAEIRRQRVRIVAPVAPEAMPAATRDPEVQLLDDLAEDRFLELIHRVLDAQEQEAVSLRCFERLPVDQVTALLGLTSATGARGVLQRARRKLKVAMEQEERRERRDGGKVGP
ncbi:MAG: sigma-70 family RNA polymerase sigma factor [bacterium]|nr:sigma-70 family RNA polymerase sigma factor [bacterium]